MASINDRDYVLGTHDDEIERLGIQHRVWRDVVLDCWQRAGIAVGSRVLDVGAGPGWATLDLAEIVGPTGSVTSVERSSRFAEAGRSACAARGMSQVDYQELDLMSDPLPPGSFDASWCRWVASFVSSPRTLVQKVAAAVRPGGTAIFHEYSDYSTWRFVPSRPRMREFLEHVTESWRASGGEPDIAPAVVDLLVEHGFRIREASPLVFGVRPGDAMWQWPASFVDVNLDRLQELGRVDAAWCAVARDEFRAAGADPNTVMITPMVLEIIAERVGPPSEM